MATASAPDSLAAVARGARELLASAGVPSPDHDAVALLAHALGMSLAECRTAIARGDAVPPGLAATGFPELVARRASREPLQHLTGRAPFRGLELEVGRGVFVPRPETEVVAGAAIEAARARADDREEPVVAIDLCAGSGAIGISLATEVPEVRVTLVELSAEAFPFLERNVAAQPDDVRSRLSALRADARTALADLDGMVDVVACNPPYVPPGATPREPEVARHDPPVALYGLGPDGLEVPRGVVAAAARLLRTGGSFIMEHGDEQGEAVRVLLQDGARWASVSTRQDLTGRDRFAVATRA